MNFLIYSDVHGNLPAFEKMIDYEKNCSGYICLGDLVNYAPWSNECVDLALSLPNSIILKGNHEEDFLTGVYKGGNLLVKAFFNETYEKFNRFNEIKRFVEETKINAYTCKHTLNNQYIYPDTNIILDSNYFIGHSHHQFEYKNSNYKLINVGSVGQNRKKIDILNYILFNTETNLIELKSIKYDITPVIEKMKEINYPKACIDYYLSKL